MWEGPGGGRGSLAGNQFQVLGRGQNQLGLADSTLQCDPDASQHLPGPRFVICVLGEERTVIDGGLKLCVYVSVWFPDTCTYHLSERRERYAGFVKTDLDSEVSEVLLMPPLAPEIFTLKREECAPISSDTTF